MTYAPAQALLTEPVWSPLHRREWLASPLQVRLLEAIGPDGYQGTLRELAARVGYAGAGAVHHAIASLVTGGLVTVRTARGRHGRTTLRLRAGVRLIRRVAAVLEGFRSTLASMAAGYVRKPSRVAEPAGAVLSGDALERRLRLVRAIPRRAADELASKHGHATDEELARCDRCAGVVLEVWTRL